MARMRYPPPGNTTTAAPFAFSFGRNKLIVGFETFPIRMTALFATTRSFAVVVLPSGPVTVDTPGAPFGQSSSVACAPDALQYVCWVVEIEARKMTASKKVASPAMAPPKNSGTSSHNPSSPQRDTLNSTYPQVLLGRRL